LKCTNPPVFVYTIKLTPPIGSVALIEELALIEEEEAVVISADVLLTCADTGMAPVVGTSNIWIAIIVAHTIASKLAL